MEFSELKKHIKTQKPYPCYFCYGDDEFVLSHAVTHISSLANGIKEFNIVDKQFGSAQELKEELMALPVMSDYRIVIARGKVDSPAVAEYLKSPNPSTVLAVVQYVPHDSWERSSAPDVPEGATPVNCNRLDIKFVYPFVKNILLGSKTEISDEDIKKLYDRCGGYMTRIDMEAQKLAVLRAGGTVTADDIESQVEADTEFVVFELSDSIINRNAERALKIVEGMAKNNDLVAAFTLLYNRFKKIFAAAVSPDDLDMLGVKPYMATKLKKEAARFTKARLKSILDMLAKADYSYKTGVVTQYDALCSFVALAANGG